MTFHLVALYYFLRLKKFGKCAGTVDEIVTLKQILRALAASCMQSRQFFFASTLPEQLFKLKNEDAF
jgi:hypothetical protein